MYPAELKLKREDIDKNRRIFYYFFIKTENEIIYVSTL